ncbi:MAG: hypothetical protein ACOYXU_06565 [Nitrospirota bacterium]
MACPKLDSRDPIAPNCRSQRGLYAPTDEQLVRLCTTEQYGRCPIYSHDLEQFLASCRREVERAVG